MNGRATREGALPGERVGFEVSPPPGCAESEIEWSGGGAPPGGEGRRFRTVFHTGGTYTIRAQCGDAWAAFRVIVPAVEDWLQRARAYYGPSIDFSRVRIRTSRLVLGAPGTAWTCNGVIRFKRPRRAADLPHEATLVHELGHVWEHQSGQAQVLAGLIEQIGRLFGRDPYDFGGPEGARRAARLTELSKEGQAQVLTEFWKSQNGYERDRRGVPFSTPGYVDDLRRLVREAGIGERAAGRRTLAGAIDAAIGRLVNAIVDRLG